MSHAHFSLNFAPNATLAAAALRKLKATSGSLLIVSGAGMSVQSGVPVFRRSDGTMSPDFLRFLALYNDARRKAGLPEAADWFDFSVPDMFRPETEAAAWQYWRWRILRAAVEPGKDYWHLANLVQYFGKEHVFVQTSNCDSLHLAAGMPEESLYEIHGSLRYVQCSAPCSDDLIEVDSAFISRLEAEEDWVPRCEKCLRCLRPNVMIFGDDQLVETRMEKQREAKAKFVSGTSWIGASKNWIVLEVGAGSVVPSIRIAAEDAGGVGVALIRVNPSREECATFEHQPLAHSKYFPLVARSEAALETLVNMLCASGKCFK